MYFILSICSIGMYFLYQMKDILCFHLLQWYTFLRIRYNKIIKYYRKGLRIERIDFYDDLKNDFVLITTEEHFIKLASLVESMNVRDIIYVNYTYNGESFIDIITQNIFKKFRDHNLLNYQPNLELIQDRSYTNKVLSCSVSIIHNYKIISNEQNVTEVVLQLLHNSINNQLLFRPIKIYILHHLKVYTYSSVVVNIVNDDCRMIKVSDEMQTISMIRRRFNNVSNGNIEYSYDLRISNKE